MKSILILSGGMDSATLLYDLLNRSQQVECLGINYAQRHRKELKCAKELCDSLSVPFDVVDLSNLKNFLMGNSQTDETVKVPFGRYDEPTMKLTVVPNRNMMMLSIAASIAIARKADAVFYGAHAGDHTIYPDCRPEFVHAINQSFRLCDWHSLELCAPYLHKTKGDIAKIGLSLGVPFEKTWTCYVGEERPCNQCGACVERAEAFEFAGQVDPLLEI